MLVLARKQTRRRLPARLDGRSVERSRGREQSRSIRAYRRHVPITPGLARSNFAALVERALNQARQRSLNDKAIHDATGVSPATFHRWQAGDLKELPKVETMLAFVDGLGVPRSALMVALGVVDPTAAPEPTIPPEVREILRILTDPRVTEREKYHITATLQSLANRHRANGPRTVKRAG